MIFFKIFLLSWWATTINSGTFQANWKDNKIKIQNGYEIWNKKQILKIPFQTLLMGQLLSSVCDTNYFRDLLLKYGELFIRLIVSEKMKQFL